ncbi:MAG: hypothetical protein CVU13_10110 [Bacteroidetes bacterium HGW-Bacteroidetes-8]|jgi:RimJ/RimL family protein N-acetyltransferase|nr:MAG: hypothetical protein CVU13_10110 [Bacteroidetes bacterium HGW-Bacteroidetes-8]
MRIFLRALEETDADSLVLWRNNPEITNSLGGTNYYISKSREIEWIKRVTTNDKHDVRLAICLVENNKHIGNVSLTSINWVNRTAEFSIMIGDKNEWGKEYGKEASILILNYAFYELNLHRIFLTVRIDNEKAKKLYEEIGFNLEGVLKEAIYKNGLYIDMLMMAILKTDYNVKL